MSHYEYICTYRHPPGTHTVADVARWIRQKASNLTLPDALCIARCLLKGESWRPPWVPAHDDAGPCHFEKEFVKDEYTLKHEASVAEYAAGKDLAERGSAGDPEAAIEFCKLFLADKMLNHAMG